MVEWFCKRDDEGIPANYEAWTTSVHLDVAEKMLQATGLINKKLATKKKAADKLDAMVKDYKNMRMKAAGSGWGTDAETHKAHVLATVHGSTVEDYILKRCPWYYKFEGLYHKRPIFNPPIIIESGQPPRRRGQAVKDTDLGGFEDAEGEVDEEEREDTISTHDDEDDSILYQPSKPQVQVQLNAPKVPVPNRSKTAPLETIERSSAKPTNSMEQPFKEKAKQAPKEKGKRAKTKRSRLEDSDSDEKSRRGRWISTKGRLTMAESMLIQVKMDDSRERDRAIADREQRQQRFQLEQQQREHHHATEMARSEVMINQGKERILRLQIELHKQLNKQQKQRGHSDISD